jgi:hypothetical protein
MASQIDEEKTKESGPPPGSLLPPLPPFAHYDTLDRTYRRHLNKTCSLQLMHIPRAALPISKKPVTSASGLDTICSYSWKLSRMQNPTIFVPGAPPKWCPPVLPFYVHIDQGMGIIDENSFRQGGQPFEPMFQAMSVMSPDFRCYDIDLIADRGALRCIIAYACGKWQSKFCVVAQVVNTTLFLWRNEGRQTNSGNSGRGHTFERAFSTDTLKMGEHQTGCHYRVQRYDFGGLNILLRHEVDAYHEDGTTPAQDPDDNLLEQQWSLNARTHPNATSVLIRGQSIPAAKMGEMKASDKYKPKQRCRCG